jgi:hypothetical protein
VIPGVPDPPPRQQAADDDERAARLPASAPDPAAGGASSLGDGPRVDLGPEDADIAQVAVQLAVVEPVPDDELVGIVNPV